MTDTVTILRTHGRYATKQVTRRKDGSLDVRGYDEAKHFRVYEREVDGLEELAALLDRVSADPWSTIIRAKPREGVDRRHARRLLHDAVDEHGEITPATFEPSARRWLLLDVDKVEGDPPCDPRDGPGVAAWVAGQMPEEMQGASYWWAFTSSAGIKPGVRMRLAYWLSRAVDQWELDLWLNGHPVDHSVFRPVQVIYLARPIFRGLADPIATRSGVQPHGAPTVEVPVIVKPEPEGAAAWERLGRWRHTVSESRSPDHDLEEALGTFCSTPEAGANAWGGHGRHHALYVAVLSLCAHIRRGFLPVDLVRREFMAAAGSLDRREEVARHIENALRRGRVA